MSEIISQSSSSVDKPFLPSPPAAKSQGSEVPVEKTEKQELSDLVLKFEAQNRSCWLCTKIAGVFKSGKELSEDDKWHLSTCVKAWENVHKMQ
ncbi:MAG: hypothetical protein HQM08_20185 [Candidatus Riflebacteria bacterium]|nr:hypothetical protein [Candidatus Riflebacteria bacterium]